MGEELLQDRKILLVEDEYFIADAMQRELEELGVQVVGPVASVDAALALVDNTPVDGAILDVNLDDEGVFPVAETLAARGIRFIFATGYNASDLPPAWRHVPRYEKPVDVRAVAAVLLGGQAL